MERERGGGEAWGAWHGMIWHVGTYRKKYIYIFHASWETADRELYIKLGLARLVQQLTTRVQGFYAGSGWECNSFLFVVFCFLFFLFALLSGSVWVRSGGGGRKEESSGEWIVGGKGGGRRRKGARREEREEREERGEGKERGTVYTRIR